MQIYHSPIIGGGNDCTHSEAGELVHPALYADHWGPYRPQFYRTAGNKGRVQTVYDHSQKKCVSFCELDVPSDTLFDQMEQDYDIVPFLPYRAVDHGHKKIMLDMPIYQHGPSWKNRLFNRLEQEGIPILDIVDTRPTSHILGRMLRACAIGGTLHRSRHALGEEFFRLPLNARVTQMPQQAKEAVRDLMLSGRTGIPVGLFEGDNTKREVVLEFIRNFDKIIVNTGRFGDKEIRNRFRFAGETIRGF